MIAYIRPIREMSPPAGMIRNAAMRTKGNVFVLLAIGLLLTGIAVAQAEKPKGTLNVVGVSHLDTQWRWTIQTTIDEYVPNTFRDNVKLLDLYPHYVFSFEGAFKYMLLKEYYPDYYERLKPYIASGRWRVAGSWVDPVDVNMPSFESLVRHTLYGNGYFQREFGRVSRDVLLPDCFGFGYSLPSIAAHCGLKSFSTQKLTWGSAYGVPFDIGIWEGVDGSTLIAALNPGSYSRGIEGDLSRDTTWIKRIDSLGRATGLYEGYHYFGTGDVGGAPESTAVAWLEKSVTSDGPLAVKGIGADDIVDIVAAHPDAKLPRYKGELVMTRHGVGCYSSEAAMKRWNRKNELLADAAERASVIADLFGGLTYPRQTLQDTWNRFLWHQFHDDLTGTSIPQAYEFSWNDELLCLNRFAGILEHAVASSTPALDTRAQGIPVVVFNPLSIVREDIVEATIQYTDGAPKAVRVYDPDGAEVPSQIAETYADSLKIVFLAKVPSVGYVVYDVRTAETPCDMATGLKIKRDGMENQRYVVRMNNFGEVSSIYDKVEGRKLLQWPIMFEYLTDTPKRWPAWEIDYDDISASPKSTHAGRAAVRIIENGPARVTLEVTQGTDDSKIRSYIRLAAGGAGDRVVFDNDIDWAERERLLKASFVMAAPNDSVTYDIGLGTITRGLNRPKLYEVPGQQWADMTASDGSYGVAVLNDSRYGWDHPDQKTLRLSLIHTPGISSGWEWVGDQRSQDIGRHLVTFAVTGHKGDWREGGVAWLAARLNQPLLAFQTTAHPGKLGKSFSLLTVDNPAVMVTAVKFAESGDDLVVRLRELTGKPQEAKIQCAASISMAKELNGVEQFQRDLTAGGGTVDVSFTPYQPKTLALTLNNTLASVAPPPCQPVMLPYNMDGVSLDDNRTDGDFDGLGNSLAGELLPDTLVYENIPFVFGSAAAGAKNITTCQGQIVSLPQGSFNRLYLLASAAGGPAKAAFGIDSRSTNIWIPDWAEPIGQWNNRVTGDTIVEKADEIAPSYINRAPVGWYGSHRHTASGENEAYRFTYLYLVRLDLPAGAKTLTLPDDPAVRVAAATVVNTAEDNIIAAQPLYDVTNATVTKIFADEYAFLDRTTVRISCPVPGAEIHYTLDGGEPTERSPLYDKPLVLTKSTTVKARSFKKGADNHHIAEAEFIKMVPRAAVDVAGTEPGLLCRYFEGTWDKIPGLEAMASQRDTVMTSISIPSLARKEGYGLMFEGFIRVPTGGAYTFSITSDDGSRLYIDDTLLIDNDGVHGEQEMSGRIALVAGLHPIKVYMFQGVGDQVLSASVQGPGMKKQIIPADMLFRAAGTTAMK